MGESALSLVARLVSRPVFFAKYSFFNDDGLKHKEVIEINGDTGTGKTLIILDLIKQCILPRVYDGAEAEVILIDTDCQFSIFQLAGMLESTILSKIAIESSLNKSKSELRQDIDESLSRLSIFTCSDLESLYLHFHYIRTFLISKPTVGVILLDSISSFYWCEMQNNKDMRRMDSYVCNILNYFHHQLSSFNIGFIYTRPNYLQSKNSSQADCSSTFNLKSVNRIVSVNYSKKDNNVVYLAEVKTLNNVYVKSFSVQKDGLIIWN